MCKINTSKNIFTSADILVPKQELLPLWSVIACDQFTSDIGYWKDIEKTVGDAPSAYHAILPEAYLDLIDTKKAVSEINRRMDTYLNEGIFRKYKNSMIYVKRKMRSGLIRKGIVGALDLTEYEYFAGSKSKIRATEQTVLERIPPRVKIRKNAPLELPHIILFVNDIKNEIFSGVESEISKLEQIYDFELIKDGGHITGFLITEELMSFIKNKISSLEYSGMQIAVGDGNHSLASAKACFEALREEIGERALSHPSRYALSELVNIQDNAIKFEPIHRFVYETDPEKLLNRLSRLNGNDYEIKYMIKGKSQVIHIPSRGFSLACGALQILLDEYLAENGGKIDYIHGDEEAARLSENGVCFLLSPLEKASLFKTIVSDGVLPRKAFSMGHAEEKRYYLEARRIR